jgi:hypothetical protein
MNVKIHLAFVYSTDFFYPHSHYTRIIQDWTTGKKIISLLLISRKWFCDNSIGNKKIFTERYGWIAENGCRTMRAGGILREISFSSSCLNGEKLARTVHLPVSHDTLLSIIKKRKSTLLYPLSSVEMNSLF